MVSAILDICDQLPLSDIEIKKHELKSLAMCQNQNTQTKPSIMTSTQVRHSAHPTNKSREPPKAQ